MEANLKSRAKKGKMSEEALAGAMAKLKGTLSYDDFKSVDMVRPGCYYLFIRPEACGALYNEWLTY